jgi:hypothetical protein
MKKTYDYSETVLLKHNELAATVNQETGEVKVKKTRTRRLPEGKEVFEPTSIFNKDYNNSWKFLCRELSDLELATVVRLTLLAKSNTNSLEPINDNTALKELSEKLSVSINKIKSVLQRLWELGIYGKFDVAEVGKPYTRYWILNPYLSFNGKLINSDIAKLFENTHIAKAHNNENYVINLDKEQLKKKRVKKSS